MDLYKSVLTCQGERERLRAVFPCYIQSVPQGGFLCSQEHGKLCFEALETTFVPQNNLPCRGENAFRSQGFKVIKNDIVWMITITEKAAEAGGHGRMTQVSTAMCFV